MQTGKYRLARHLIEKHGFDPFVFYEMSKAKMQHEHGLIKSRSPLKPCGWRL